MIHFDDTLQALYFLSGDQQDWMAGINSNPDGSHTLRYRFRYYDPKDPDNDPHSDQDRKNWTQMTSRPGVSLQDSLDGLQEVVDGLLAAGYVPKGGLSCKLIRGSMSTEKFMEEFKKLPFVHMRTVRAKKLP